MHSYADKFERKLHTENFGIKNFRLLLPRSRILLLTMQMVSVIHQTTLQNERVQVPIDGGERAGPFEIIVEALLDEGPSFPINEVGFILGDGTLLAVWANPDILLAYKTTGVLLVVSLVPNGAFAKLL